MNQNEKTERFKTWAQTLEVGSAVAIDVFTHWGCRYQLTEVDSITKSGRIRTKNGYEFSPEGRVRGTRDPVSLVPVTDKITDIVNRYEYTSYISRKSEKKFLEKLSTEDLAIINNILKKTEETE